ncbi:MAG: His-Xaa-Ser system radical SAM maturase HxsB [Elusimicrobia bacterium GWA2_61_42]|nr:MAG: His-Xaa-Ser system radical SAM maturase HxsB [Elusimicrobia bacterium GWA2_61_42]OGR79944.1 MAG: His-Xaa-Ser system radical SAM maturase HxsB [Elusimicrobia bacterium GWC2_61_25]
MALKKAAKKTSAAAVPPQLLWKRDGADFLVTNDFGHYSWLKKKDFDSLLACKVGESHPLFAALSAKGFVRDRLDFDGLAAKWRKKNAYLNTGPGLHILVLTLRCNHKCLYCQAAAGGAAAKDTDMTPATARKCVDFAFNSSNPGITIEFQGGEPLLNWPALTAAVKHARARAKTAGKELKLALVSNFSLMTEEKARFLMENEVSVCTSLDGPADLHNKNRCFSGGNSHAVTLKWLKYFQKKNEAQADGYRVFKPSALLTVSRYSLSRHKEIIDEYVAAGLEDIFIRPLAPIGYARNLWGSIGYEAKDFAAFYLKSLAYILKLNRSGVVIREKMAAMMLDKIVNSRDPGYLDARCPCGAAIGQIAYNYNGDLYTCDEGRMVGWEGDDVFKVGSVFKDSYAKVMASAPTRACVVSSNLEAQPDCARCVYKPYCGVCPVYNYEVQGSLWGDMSSSDRCGLFKGIFGALFALLKKPGNEATLKKWVDK